MEWNKGKHPSEKARRNMSLAHKGQIPWNKGIIGLNKGKKHTEESKRRQAESMKGKSPWNKGKTNCYSGKYLKQLSERMKGNTQMKGKILTIKTRGKMSLSRKGYTPSIEARKKMAFQKVGPKNSNWRGGISFEPYGIEFNKELKNQILQRDNYQCQLTGKKKSDGFRLCIHHKDYNKKNNDPRNLITLWNKAHTKTNARRNFWESFFLSGFYKMNLGDFNKEESGNTNAPYNIYSREDCSNLQRGTYGANEIAMEEENKQGLPRSVGTIYQRQDANSSGPCKTK